MVNSNVSEVSLPSAGCIPNYPKTVKISTLTVAAFKLYSTINKSNSLSVMKEIVSLCVQDSIDVGNLKNKDFEFLLMWLRINSDIPGSDNIYEYHRTCSSCTHQELVKKDLTTMDVISLQDYKEPEMIKLKSTDKELGLKLLTIDDEIEIMMRLEDKAISNTGDILRAAFSIDSKVSYDEKIKFISNLSNVADLASILDFISVFSTWGFTFNSKTKCAKCETEEEEVLPLRLDLFIPTFQYEGSFRKSRVG